MTLEERIAAIEARQRLYSQHDPSCALRPWHQGDQPPSLASRCTCWLDQRGDW
ncbi:hypothetical protein [Rathayibacter sp. VKM Ac-2630]|uniref:hypothetical protein n=1 Tax=Rathayibacter sp. VKM Ac-2630 TaxID=1938617 RepID=UPI001301477D|nr:hypothetical protein [Rathayibacter sp. VKM Ac-2630]